jgi:hypothetical protein
LHSTSSGSVAVLAPGVTSVGREVSAADPSLLDSAYLNARLGRRSVEARPGWVSVYPNGIIAQHVARPGKLGGGIRGEISGFSRESKQRLLERLIRLDLGRDWFFLTLTYADEWSRDSKVWKKDLNTFHSALVREYGGGFGGAIWRLERQKRGAPHFHLLIHFVDGRPQTELQRWVRETWTRILGKPQNANWVRTQVQRVEIRPNGGVGKLLNYLSKYLGKIDAGGWIDPTTGEILNTGRVWGQWGTLPYVVPSEVVEVSPFEWVILARRVRRWGKKSKYLRSLTADRLTGVFYGLGPLARGLSLAKTPT